MAFSDQVRFSYVGEDSLSYVGSYSGGARADVDEAIPANQTNLQVAFALVYAKCKSFLIVSEGGALTVKTNSTSSPGKTWSLVDGEPLVWTEKMLQTAANFFVADVTTLYLTNTTAVTCRIRCLYDPT